MKPQREYERKYTEDTDAIDAIIRKESGLQGIHEYDEHSITFATASGLPVRLEPVPGGGWRWEKQWTACPAPEHATQILVSLPTSGHCLAWDIDVTANRRRLMIHVWRRGAQPIQRAVSPWIRGGEPARAQELPPSQEQ